MGDVAHELPAGVVRGLDILRHRVEGAGQVCDLAFPGDPLHPDRQVSAAETLGRIADLLQRHCDPAHQQTAGDVGKQQHQTGREKEVGEEFIPEILQPCAGGAQKQIPAALPVGIPHLAYRNIALFRQDALQIAEQMVAALRLHLIKQRKGHLGAHHLAGTGTEHHPALRVGEEQAGFRTFSNDLQPGVQHLQLLPFREAGVLHHIIRCAAGHIRHAVQGFVPFLGKVAAKQHPLRAAHYGNAQHQQGGHHGEQRHRYALAHY